MIITWLSSFGLVSDVIVQLRMLSSTLNETDQCQMPPSSDASAYFRCFLAISDAIVHFRTISSNFEHCRLILDANVRIRTLSSDFKSFYSIPEAIV